MNILKKCMSIVFAVSLIIVTIINAVDIAAYSDFGFYKKEYTKYKVNEPGTIVDMEIDELMRVTKEMMSYLRGNRKDLVIEATVNGKQVEFFNEIEKLHMKDVRDLFVKAIIIRRICVLLMIMAATVLILMKQQARRLLSRGVMWAIGIFNGMVLVLMGIISIDFTRAFTIFHEIFFDNDMWLLDPNTERLINIVPEPFFIDMAIRIAIIYFIINLLNFLLAFLLYRGKINRSNFSKNTITHDGGTYEQG